MLKKFLKEDSTRGEFSRFVIVGGFTTLLNYAIFALLFFLGVNYVLSSAVGYISGFFVGFVLFKRFTFKSQGQWKKELAKQVVVYGVSLALNLATLYYLVHWFGISPLLANVAAIGVSTVTNFVGMKYLVFSQR